MQAIVFNKTRAAIVSGTVGYLGFSVGVYLCPELNQKMWHGRPKEFNSGSIQ